MVLLKIKIIMKEITLNNKNYLLVEVSDDAFDFNVAAGNIMFLYHDLDIHPNGFELIKYDNNDLLLIGKISDILKDEEICKGLVEENKAFLYKNYMSDNDKAGFNNATFSFISYLQSINLDMSKEYLFIRK